ncbi:hypothetical protein [Planctomicrobium piriforme]|uniref:Uncharacterized protein n=1 Tax=Planctomicrobium piriforme TaxID=1576369 RepID=A0A1I3Q150_9PLAN|nr:hypothetical protein [Planctomicrobium piriforme]SFJ27449.1 hypothetical protein SAMN05421753_117105 [Planctomicrobium piriforme]
MVSSRNPIAPFVAAPQFRSGMIVLTAQERQQQLLQQQQKQQIDTLLRDSGPELVSKLLQAEMGTTSSVVVRDTEGRSFRMTVKPLEVVGDRLEIVPPKK